MSTDSVPEIDFDDENPDTRDGTISDKDMIDPFDPTKIEIQVKQDTLRNIIDRLAENAIDMNTDFQRHADLWSIQTMSRLIESVLIRFPLPAFYFDASIEDNWLIVDGLQRLSSIRRFVVEKNLRLVGLDFLKELEGCDFDSLPRTYQRRIHECPVTLFLIQPGTPDQVKYSIFRRINTGGLVLNNQEIRNALAKPRERKFLENLTQDSNLIRTMGNQSKRMLDQELILRFLAFLKLDYLKSRKNIAEFLDDAMEFLSKRTREELDSFGAEFKRAIRLSYEVFGDSAFEKQTEENPKGHKRKNATLFEVWCVCLAKISDEKAEIAVQRREIIIQKLAELNANDESFYRAISMATQKREHVKIRYDRVESIIDEVTHA